MPPRTVSAVFFTALALRLLVLAAALAVSGSAVLQLVDSHEYLALARSLALEGRFYAGDRPELLRLPGYPSFLALGVLAGQPVALALLLQAVLGSVTAVLGFEIGRLVGGERAALCAGLLCACEPLALAWGCFVMAETLLTACVTSSVLCAARYQLAGSPRWLLGACLSACAAAYVKPVAFLFPIWLGLLLLVRALLSAERRARARHALAFLGLSAVLLSAWPLRNGLVGGYWGFSRQLEHVAGATAYRVAVPKALMPSPARDALRARFLPSPGSGGALDDAAQRDVGATLLSSPIAQLRSHAIGSMRTLFHPGAMAYLELFGGPSWSRELRVQSEERDWRALTGVFVNRAPAVALLWAVLGIANAALVALAVLALLSGARRRPLLLLAASAAYFVLAGGGPWSQSRLRHPAMPMLCVLAGISLAERTSARS